MAGISFIGSYSGIDKSMIDQLMEAERLPLVQLSNKKTTLTQKQNAWRDINTRLNSLFEKIKVLQKKDTFLSKTSTSTNDEIVTLSPSNNAVEGKYKIHVKQLATSASIISGEIDLDGKGLSDELGIEGKLTIKNNDYTEGEDNRATINIESTDSLRDIANKINSFTKDRKDPIDKEKTIKGTGITATIIDNKLVLSDEKTGERDITLEGDDVVLSGLSLGEDIRTDIDGQKAIFTVNDLEIKRDSNSVKDAIDGVTVNLHKEHKDGEYDTVTVSMNTEEITKAVQDFVDQYNSTMKYIEEKLAAGDPDIPGSAGILSGDGTLMRLHSSLRSMVTAPLDNENTPTRDISQLGVSTIDKYGQLKFDSAKFIKALENDTQDIINFFSSKDSDGEEIGFVSRINTYIDSFISKNGGVIKTKTEGIDKILNDLNKQIENFNARMEKKEEYYTKKFAALDIAMMKAESQMEWLQGQMDAMNGAKRK